MCDIIHTVYLSSSHRARPLYRIEILLSPGYALTVAVLGTAIKESHCISVCKSRCDCRKGVSLDLVNVLNCDERAFSSYGVHLLKRSVELMADRVKVMKCVCSYLASSTRRNQSTLWRVTARGASFLSSIRPAWPQYRITRRHCQTPRHCRIHSEKLHNPHCTLHAFLCWNVSNSNLWQMRVSRYCNRCPPKPQLILFTPNRSVNKRVVNILGWWVNIGCCFIVSQRAAAVMGDRPQCKPWSADYLRVLVSAAFQLTVFHRKVWKCFEFSENAGFLPVKAPAIVVTSREIIKCTLGRRILCEMCSHSGSVEE
jgi:hypothetical protein